MTPGEHHTVPSAVSPKGYIHQIYLIIPDFPRGSISPPVSTRSIIKMHIWSKFHIWSFHKCKRQQDTSVPPCCHLQSPHQHCTGVILPPPLSLPLASMLFTAPHQMYTSHPPLPLPTVNSVLARRPIKLILSVDIFYATYMYIIDPKQDEIH